MVIQRDNGNVYNVKWNFKSDKYLCSFLNANCSTYSYLRI